MDPTSFEQFELAAEIVDDASKYLKEGDELSLQFFDGRVINVELPKNKYLEVTYTEDVVKGDTTSSVLKDATLETGLVVKVQHLSSRVILLALTHPLVNIASERNSRI